VSAPARPPTGAPAGAPSSTNGDAGAPGRPGFEAWAWFAFALGVVTAGLLLFLGFRPGGLAPVLAYSWGLLLLGGASAVALTGALLWCVRRRPLLQRRRAIPLFVLGACLWLCSLPIAYPSSHEGHPSATVFRLPFEGAARVRFGGDRRATNPMLVDPSGRFGVCFEPEVGETLAVLAPAAGRLVEAHDLAIGRRLVLEVAPGEFLVLTGLDPAGAGPTSGAEVSEGASLGRARNLYVHLQDGPRSGRSEGIPMRFRDYAWNGRQVEVGSPVPPQVVSRWRDEAAGPDAAPRR